MSDISSEESSANIKRILNFKDKFDEENLTKLRDLLNSTHEESSILLLVTDKNEFWELIKRSDITTDSLSDPKSIQSLPYDIFKNGIKLKLETEHNINNDSINNSDFDLSQISDFNISSLIKDTENQVSDNS